MARSNETGSKKFSSTFSRGSEEDYSIVCLPCYRDDSATVPASGYCIDCKEHLCPTCLKYHKKATLSSHHKLLDKDAMPTTQSITDTSIHAGFSDNLTTPCSRHKNEIIKLYCHDHDLPLCSICIALEHKSCHVDYIPEISDQMIDSKEYKDITKRIDNLLIKCSTTMSEASRDTNSSNDSLKTALEEVETYRQRINERMDELEKAVKDEYEDLQTKNDEKMGTIKTICEDVMKVKKTTYNNMKQLNATKQGNKLFIEVKQALKQLQDSEESVSSMSKVRFYQFKFVPNQTIHDVLQNEKMIGDILRPVTFSELIPETSADDIAPKHVRDIHIQTSAGMFNSSFSGMTLLSPERLVLVDRNNNSVMMIDVNSGANMSELYLNDKNEPRDITSTTRTQVAVTIPEKRHIQLISASDGLKKQGTIKTAGECYALCCYKNKLVVTYNVEEKLEILDMKGKVITKITTDSTGKNIFNDPCYVKANRSAIYVSDLGHREVIMLNWEGEITGRCRDLETPMGLALLGDGSLLVCDLELSKIYQLSGDCRKSRVIQQDMGRPMAVCLDNKQHTFYISRDSLLIKYKNYIGMYGI